MGVALLVIAVLVGLVVLLLAVPVHMTFRFAGIEAPAGQLTIRWLFGLTRFRITVPRVSKPKPPRPEPEPQALRTGKPEARGRRANVIAAFSQAAFRRRVYRFLRDLVRAAHVHELYLDMRLGLGDPADTGRLWAVVGPLSAMAQNLPRAEIRVEPEFIEPVLEFEARGRVILIPLRLIVLVIAFALSPSSIRAWRTLKGRHG